ncbi:MAG: ATP-binding protein [Acidimicrobiales bacterium]
MSTGQRRAIATPIEVMVALVMATVLVSAGLLGAREIAANAEDREVLSAARLQADVAVGVALDLERASTAVAEGARNLTAPVPIDATRIVVPGATAVGSVTADAERTDAGSVLPLSTADREMRALLDRARDTGDSVLSTPIPEGDGFRTVIASAAYRRDASVGRPPDVMSRRARLVGWVVATIDLGRILSGNLPDGSAGTITEGAATASVGGGAADDGRPGAQVSVDDHVFDIRVAIDDPGVPTPAILVGLVGVGLAGLAVASVLLVGRRTRELREAVATRSGQVALIGEVAPLVQQSLELAEVLPAVAIQLTDLLGLAGVTVSTGGRGVDQVGLFSMGSPPDATVRAVLRPPSELAAGATLVLAMQRGDRSVARLALVAGRDLDAADLQSLRAISELVTAAVVNASLYASQQEALRNLRDLDALKTVFLGTASHELRTPATAITGFASLLSESWDRFDDDQRRDFVRRIDANARSLSAVVQDLLDFALLDGGAVTLTVEPVDVSALVTSVVDRLGPLFTLHEIEVSTEPAPQVEGDVHALERAVTNLLTNAVKFSPPGSTVSLASGPTPDGFGAQIMVSDEGPGIPPEERSRVFARFYRGTGDAVVQTRGVGIGLSVVSELVARLRGEVLVDEAPGGGARFTIRLPAAARPSSDPEVEDASTT